MTDIATEYAATRSRRVATGGGESYADDLRGLRAKAQQEGADQWRLLIEAALAFEGERDETAAELVERLEQRIGWSDRPEDAVLATLALAYRAQLYRYEKKYPEAIRTCDELLRRSSGSDAPALREPLARALVDRGYCQRKLGQLAEAIASFDELLQQPDDPSRPEVVEIMVRALLQKGFALHNLERHDDAIAVFAEAAERFGAATEPLIVIQVARTQFSKGGELTMLGRYAEVVVALGEVLTHLGNCSSAQGRELIALALSLTCNAHHQLGQDDERLAAAAELIRRFGAASEPVIADSVADAFLDQAEVLMERRQVQSCLGACEQALRRRAELEGPPHRDHWSEAAACLHEGKRAEAVEALGKLEGGRGLGRRDRIISLLERAQSLPADS